MLFGTDDEHEEIALEVRSTNMDDAMGLVHHVGHEPYLSKSLVITPERTTPRPASNGARP